MYSPFAVPHSFQKNADSSCRRPLLDFGSEEGRQVTKNDC
jgi:hypothetical protein